MSCKHEKLCGNRFSPFYAGIPIYFFGLVVGITATAVAAKQPLPIIDMHLHAASPEAFGGAQTICTNTSNVEFPPVDPKHPATVQNTAICDSPLMSSTTNEENAKKTAATMKELNIYGVLDISGGKDDSLNSTLEYGEQWKQYAPNRYWTAIDFINDKLPPVADLEALFTQDKIQLFAELSPQYSGEKVVSSRLDPYFAMAERLEIPIGLHLGEGPPGGNHVMPGGRYTLNAGRPMDIDPLLNKYPRLRLYVMHFGSPLVEEMIALMYAHPNVYVDVAQNNWGFPRAHFYRQLQQLVDAGFSKRIMFGSDQMIWPDTILIAIETINQAPFLKAHQKRDILYNNAARFLRLSDAEIARHHGQTID